MSAVRNSRLLTSQLTRQLSIYEACGLSQRTPPRNILSQRTFSTSTGAMGKNSIVSESNRLYTSDGHYWVRTIKSDKIDDRTHFEIGLTQNVLDNVIRGPVDCLNLPNISANKIENENEGLNIHWSGLEVGTGDELYHSVWKNIEGIFTVEPFLPIQLKDLCVYEYNRTCCENPDNLTDDWLLKISCDQRDLGLLSGIFKSLRVEGDHDKFCQSNSDLLSDKKELYNK